MKIISLFDGVSCARLAIEKAGIPIEAYYASEIDKYAIKVTQANRPDTIQLGNVTNIKYDTFDKCLDVNNYLYNGEYDLLIGGSPCQDLSIAKKDRKGLDGERSSLFWEYVRILNEVKPKYFILENVASMPQKDKDIISQTLGVQPVMINASLVSAQNRKRLFWVGRRTDNDNYEQVYVPQPEDKGMLLKDILEDNVDEKYFVECTKEMIERGNRYEKKGQAGVIRDINGKSSTLTLAGRGGADNLGLYKVGQFNSGGQGDRVYSQEGKSVALSAMGGGRGAKTGLYVVNKKEIILGDEPLQVLKEGRTELGKQSRKEIREKTGKDSTYRSKDHKAYFGREGIKANCLTTGLGMEGTVVNNFVIRKLTPIECERLQCMPDNWTNPTGDISNSQRYKMCGNAFNVDVVAHIIKHLK